MGQQREIQNPESLLVQLSTCLNIVAGGQFLILRLPASMYNVVRGKVIAPDHATKRTLHAGARRGDKRPSDPLSENECAIPWQLAILAQFAVTHSKRARVWPSGSMMTMSMHLESQDISQLNSQFTINSQKELLWKNSKKDISY